MGEIIDLVFNIKTLILFMIVLLIRIDFKIRALDETLTMMFIRQDLLNELGRIEIEK